MKKFLDSINRLELGDYHQELAIIIEKKKKEIDERNAKGIFYNKVLSSLPEVTPSSCLLNGDIVKIGEKEDLSSDQNEKVFQALRDLMPWRKGPFEFFGTFVDSEWVSFKKWDRFSDKVDSFHGKRILDIGSSSGYYMFRIADSMPQMVIGIEPYLTFYYQYRMIQHFITLPDIYCLPLKFDEMPVLKSYFDTILCMGVLYHQRSPLKMLSRIRSFMKRDGELILETLIIEGEDELALFPKKRYAKMNNIYFLPTVSCLENWLSRTGFKDIRLIDISKTTLEEQRKTDWIQTESLSDFLSPSNSQKTIEGYPAPVRAIIFGRAK